MKKLLFVSVMFIAFKLSAQDQQIKDIQSTASKKVEDDTSHKKGWKTGLLVNLGLAQGNSSNWAAGAETNSFSVNAYLNLHANLKSEKNVWTNNLDLFYALITTTSQGTRKNDDRIDFFSKYTYKLSKTWGVGAVGNFRTQFSDGYDYNKTPKERTSSFMAPGYMTLAPGVDWTPTEHFSVFISPFSGRWTYVGIDSLTGRYGLDPGKNWRSEAGAYLTAAFNKEIFKNVFYKGRLDLYSNYLDGKAKNVDVFWTNLFALKVNKFLTVTYNFDLIYDDDVRIFGPNNDAPRTQVKSLLSVGLSARL